MSFNLILTLEKPESDIIDIIWSVESYQPVANCFLYEGNPYIEGIIEWFTDDRSYVEYHVPFHSQRFYEMWFEEFKDVFIPFREQSFSELKSLGVELKEYWDDCSIEAATTDSLSSTLFVSRFPEQYQRLPSSQPI